MIAKLEVFTNPTPPAKGCMTCRFKVGSNNRDVWLWRCGRTGWTCTTETEHGGDCGSDLLHWAPHPPRPPRIGFWRWLKRLWFGDPT